jgi:general stress protein CsbA
MELSWLLVFKIGASLAGVLAGIGMFSELPWPVKLKVTATLLVGIILIGFLAPLGTPVEPFGVISVPTFGGAITLAGLAVLAGFIGYFISWPNGREIGILAVPAGLAIWAVRGGNMAELMRLAPTLAQRQVLFAALKWEPIFWLAIVAAGFGGVLIGQKIIAKHEPNESQEKSDSKANTYLNVLIAVVGSVFIAQFCIGIFAQDVRIPDHRLGSVMAQPAVGQIVFAVLVSFGIAAFLVKKFLDASYIWPIAASALVTGFAVITYIKEDTLQYLVEHHPPIFFSRVVTSILPVQMVAFGVLGSIAGYWLVVCYNHWRKHP